jgi:hypothetical protein
MVVNLEQLKGFFPKQLCLEFSEREQNKARFIASQYKDAAGSDRAFLNSLCLEVISPSIKDIFDVKERDINIAQIQKEHLSIWQSLNGVAINLSLGRLVLIPTEELDTEELRVPQAWVDQPELAGDFYLAIQVSPEESWLRVWGFTTQKKLKELGIYDARDRSYAIDRGDLWSSLETMPAIWSVNPPTQEFVQEPIYHLNILSQLDFSPIWQPFEEFAAMFNWQIATDLRQSRFQRHWARKIDQVITLKDHPFALTIGFQEETPHKYLVQVRISSGNEEIYLPDDLKLLVLETNGEVIDVSKSRKADNWIQVEFTGEIHDEFQVKIQRAEISIIEDFII